MLRKKPLPHPPRGQNRENKINTSKENYETNQNLKDQYNWMTKKYVYIEIRVSHKLKRYTQIGKKY